jgi:HKD family nuclease
MTRVSGLLRPGPRDHLLTEELVRLLESVDPALIVTIRLDGAEGPRRLAQHLATAIERRLRGFGTGAGSASDQAELVNRLIDQHDADAVLVTPPEVWTGLRAVPTGLSSTPAPVPLPATPLAASDVLVNAHGQPNIGSELRAELASADHVDLICAFVIWSGVVQLRDALRGVVERGGLVRVITTTYMGATQRKAVDELVRLGADVKVAFDARTTKLHAKAWLLERGSGLTTAFIGSSNLSPVVLAAEIPLLAHARYSRDEILAAYAVGTPERPPQVREGVKHVADAKTDLFFVTLNKSDRDYSPTTMYRDYAISRELFHWESQATQSPNMPGIRRYVEHERRGHTIMLFVRARKRGPDGTTPPYYCLGPARYVQSSGDRPVSFTWRLETAMPEELFEVARTVAAA